MLNVGVETCVFDTSCPELVKESYGYSFQSHYSRETFYKDPEEGNRTKNCPFPAFYDCEWVFDEIKEESDNYFYLDFLQIDIPRFVYEDTLEELNCKESWLQIKDDNGAFLYIFCGPHEFSYQENMFGNTLELPRYLKRMDEYVSPSEFQEVEKFEISEDRFYLKVATKSRMRVTFHVEVEDQFRISGFEGRFYYKRFFNDSLFEGVNQPCPVYSDEEIYTCPDEEETAFGSEIKSHINYGQFNTDSSGDPRHCNYPNNYTCSWSISSEAENKVIVFENVEMDEISVEEGEEQSPVKIGLSGDFLFLNSSQGFRMESSGPNIFKPHVFEIFQESADVNFEKITKNTFVFRLLENSTLDVRFETDANEVHRGFKILIISDENFLEYLNDRTTTTVKSTTRTREELTFSSPNPQSTPNPTENSSTNGSKTYFLIILIILNHSV